MKNRSGETLADRDPREDRKRQYVEQKLFDMGFSRKQVGFPYIVEALLLLADDKPHGMTSEVYPMIAREYNVSKEGVERSIRSAIEVTFRHLNKEDRLRYYPFAYDEQKGRPSNTDFLVKFSEKLRLS
jgi:two-component system response regulator (stage 0 sporulation protein A)